MSCFSLFLFCYVGLFDRAQNSKVGSMSLMNDIEKFIVISLNMCNVLSRTENKTGKENMSFLEEEKQFTKEQKVEHPALCKYH